VERVNVSSTSKAARLLKDDPKAAAISNFICAEIYNTSVIAESIQDTQSTFFWTFRPLIL
jgi:prephenate dehydratase